jgi:hypothetical protein
MAFSMLEVTASDETQAFQQDEHGFSSIEPFLKTFRGGSSLAPLGGSFEKYGGRNSRLFTMYAKALQ